MTNQIIRRFQMPGQTVERNMIKTQDVVYRALIQLMKDEGFVPLYDIDPVWQWKWIEGDQYEFVLTMQGVHIGKDKAWETDGISGGKAVPSTPKDK